MRVVGCGLVVSCVRDKNECVKRMRIKKKNITHGRKTINAHANIHRLSL